MTSISARPHRSPPAATAGSRATFIRSAPTSTSRPRKPLDPHDARHSPCAKAENARHAPPRQFRHHARPRDAASSGGDRLFRAVGNRRPRRMDFRLPGGISGRHLQFCLQDDAERRTAFGHMVYFVRSDPRIHHRHHFRLLAGTGAVVLGIRGAAGRAFHRRHQQRAQNRAGGDRGALVRHGAGVKGRIVSIANRDRGADRRLPGGKGCRRRPAIAANLDGCGQTSGLLQSGGAIDAAVDHRDIPDQCRLRTGRRRGGRIHLLAARAWPPDLHRVQPVRPQHGLGRTLHADDHGVRPLLRDRHYRAGEPALETGNHHASGTGLRPMLNIRRRRMLLLTRIARAAAVIAILLAAPALAENKKVTLSQAFQSMLYLPLYVAIDEGFFTQQGLDLTKETAGAPTVALSAVISGSAQFSIHGPEWTAIAASKGAPVNVIANVVNGAAVWIATAPDFKFESIKDVKGQKVVTGLMPTTSTSLFMKLLKENGMDAKTDTDMIQVAIGTEPGPFVAKQADIAVMYEPGLDQAVAKGMKVVMGFPKSYGPYAFSAVTARNDVDPDAAQRVVNGMEMAMRFMAKNEARTVEIAKKELPTLDPVVVEAAVKRMLADGVYPPSVDIAADALKISMDTQIALGNLAAQPDYKAFVVKKFIEPALAMK